MHIAAAMTPTYAQDAVSREVSVYNDLSSLAGASDTVSREASIYNDVFAVVGVRDAVSRETALFNDLLGVDPDVGRKNKPLFSDLRSTASGVRVR